MFRGGERKELGGGIATVVGRRWARARVRLMAGKRGSRRSRFAVKGVSWSEGEREGSRSRALRLLLSLLLFSRSQASLLPKRTVLAKAAKLPLPQALLRRFASSKMLRKRERISQGTLVRSDASKRERLIAVR